LVAIDSEIVFFFNIKLKIPHSLTSPHDNKILSSFKQITLNNETFMLNKKLMFGPHLRDLPAEFRLTLNVIG